MGMLFRNLLSDSSLSWTGQPRAPSPLPLDNGLCVAISPFFQRECITPGHRSLLNEVDWNLACFSFMSDKLSHSDTVSESCGG
jgi:hypothetical protein